MSDERIITCSHCRSDIPYGANVCKGCRAEIKYGTPGFFMLLGFLMPAGVGYFIAKYLVTSLGFGENAGLIVWGIIAAGGWYGAFKICRACFGDYVSFTRLKNQ
ncbi:hypothetical protein JK231_21705 [Pantoea sp. JGM49]|uniref:hypothetical protein n=1 Tax=Pantoea sp. JGM49 TaxID=2799791 RepID=UPI001BA8B88E|nr:hypothetical protein [Pantoea sp. JGM49]MBS0883211.1 hypothetical protein [Pantoea sp. JGM49]